MRKFIIGTMAVAMLAIIPAVASADVPRHQMQTGSLTVTLPEYNLVHTFTDVTVNPCEDGAFTGVSGTRNVGGVVEEVSGSIKNGQVAFNAIYTESNYPSEIGYNWHTTTPGHAIDSNGLEFDAVVTSDLTSTNYKNHGQYVKAMGGGDDAAHSCIGMPVNSTQGSK